MLLYAADALDAAEREALRAHLASGCPQCAGALAEAEATVAHLPQSLTPATPPKQARDRLMQRVLADQTSPGVKAPAANWRPYATAAAVLVVLGGVALKLVSDHYQRQLAVANGEKNLLQGRLDDDQQQLVELRRMKQMIGTSNLDLVKLASQETKAHGRILWDHDKGRWRVEVFDLSPPAPGREFELWFITPDDRKIPAGTFRVDASGRGIHEVDVPKDIGPIKLAAITDEPIGGVQQPTGSIRLLGNVQ